MVAQYGVGIRGLWKRGWSEVPHVMASLPFAFLGFGMALYVMYDWKYHETPKKRYRYEYTVFRPNDPRWKTVRLD